MKKVLVKFPSIVAYRCRPAMVYNIQYLRRLGGWDSLRALSVAMYPKDRTGCRDRWLRRKLGGVTKTTLEDVAIFAEFFNINPMDLVYMRPYIFQIKYKGWKYEDRLREETVCHGYVGGSSA